VKQCQPVSIDGNCLRIEVYASSWLYVLKSQERLIQSRVSAYSHGAITAVALSASRGRR
jgi:hypothetical protein